MAHKEVFLRFKDRHDLEKAIGFFIRHQNKLSRYLHVSLFEVFEFTQDLETEQSQYHGPETFEKGTLCLLIMGDQAATNIKFISAVAEENFPVETRAIPLHHFLDCDCGKLNFGPLRSSTKEYGMKKYLNILKPAMAGV